MIQTRNVKRLMTANCERSKKEENEGKNNGKYRSADEN